MKSIGKYLQTKVPVFPRLLILIIKMITCNVIHIGVDCNMTSYFQNSILLRLFLVPS